MEEWAPIADFPGYEVSDHGRVRNATTGRVLGTYDNGRGFLQVVMRRDGRTYARAVHRLVAAAFLPPPPREDAVPMFVNGDRTDVRPENLIWKPRWFAIKYYRQAKRTKPSDRRRVRMIDTMTEYPNALECAKAIGGLEELVLIAAASRGETHYMGSAFEFIWD